MSEKLKRLSLRDKLNQLLPQEMFEPLLEIPSNELGLCLGSIRDVCRALRDDLWIKGDLRGSELMNLRMDALDYLIEEHRYDYRAGGKRRVLKVF